MSSAAPSLGAGRSSVRESHGGLGRLNLGALQWRSHLVVLAIIVLLHGTAFYFVTRARTSANAGVDGPPMFRPVVSNVWVPERMGISSRPWRPEALADAIPPPLHWTFPPIDLWPTAEALPAVLSEFTPVTDAEPVPPETRTFIDQAGHRVTIPYKRHSTLRMVRWLRPMYSSRCAAPDVQRLAVLEVQIDPTGEPARITLVQSSGSPDLDAAALHAANRWRFAPPVWKQHSVQVLGRIELRFNC